LQRVSPSRFALRRLAANDVADESY
jgi:hypothetical protein